MHEGYIIVMGHVCHFHLHWILELINCLKFCVYMHCACMYRAELAINAVLQAAILGHALLAIGHAQCRIVPCRLYPTVAP